MDDLGGFPPIFGSTPNCTMEPQIVASMEPFRCSDTCSPHFLGPVSMPHVIQMQQWMPMEFQTIPPGSFKGEWTPGHQGSTQKNLDIQKISTTKCQERHEPFSLPGIDIYQGIYSNSTCNFKNGWIRNQDFMGPPHIFSHVSPASSSFLGCTWSSWPTLGSSAILRRSFSPFLANSYLRIGWLKTWGLNFQIQGCNSLGLDIV